MKLPRRRGSRRHRRQAEVLDQNELAKALQCEVDRVEQQLKRRDLPYHKDSSGQIWATWKE